MSEIPFYPDECAHGKTEPRCPDCLTRRLLAAAEKCERLERALAKALDWFDHHSFSHAEECPAVCVPVGYCDCEAKENNDAQDALVDELRRAVAGDGDK